MPRTCTVCKHPEIENINQMLVACTGSIRDVAGQFKLSKTSLSRHKAHISETLLKAKDVQGRLQGDTLLDRLKEINRETLEILKAARVPDDLYRAIRPMLAVSGGRLILMSTPFGKRGHFFEEWTNGGEQWNRIEIRATDCIRIKPEFLREERVSLGDWWYRQEYLCEFVETIDQVFNYDHIMQAITPDVMPLFEGGT